jgi:hypothetical protein
LQHRAEKVSSRMIGRRNAQDNPWFVDGTFKQAGRPWSSLPFDKPGDIHCASRCYSQKMRHVRPSSVEFVMGSFGIRRKTVVVFTIRQTRGYPLYFSMLFSANAACASVISRICNGKFRNSLGLRPDDEPQTAWTPVPPVQSWPP